MDLYLTIGGLLLVVINILASIFCFRRDDLNRFQKFTQSAIVWFVPLLGAILVYSINSSIDSSMSHLNGSDAPTGEHSSAATGNSGSSFGGDGGGGD